MKKSKAIIIDDEPLARKLLNGMCQEYCPQIEIVAMEEDLPNGVKAIKKWQPDLVFLDIEMPGHSGLEILKFFTDQEVNFKIIFTTSYNEYALQAFKLSAIDYLLKPIVPDDLIQSIERFKKNSNNNYDILKTNLSTDIKKKVAIATASTIKFIELDDILYLKAEGAYTKLFIKNANPILASKGLKHFDDLLNDIPNFFRCHKSYIININYITDYVKSEGGYLKIDQHEINISSEKVEAFLKLMQL